MKKLIGFLILAVLLLYPVREILYIGIRKNIAGEYNKLNTLFLRQNHFNTVFAGSSRCETHFNPSVFDSITQTNSYNIGIEGATMPVIFDCVSAYFEKSSVPKNLILNIDFFYQAGNSDDGEMIFRFPRYFPYLSNKTLYKRLCAHDKRFPLFKWLPFYSMPYFNENYLNHSLNGYFKFRSDEEKYKSGFLPLSNGNEDIDTLNYSEKIVLPEEAIYNSLDSIITLCRQKNIDLIFVFSPIYYKDFNSIGNKYQLLQKFKAVAEKNKIKVFNYSNVSLCYDKHLFKDSRHLNEKGSSEFTRIFAKDVNAHLRKY